MRKFVSLLAFLIGAVAASGQTALDGTLAALDKVKTLSEAAISPDGKTVAWTESANGDPQSARMLIRPLGEGRERAAPVTGARGAAWAPDSARLAFLAPEAGSADARQLQLWVMTVSGKGAFKPHRMTGLKGFLATPQWAPDGRSIAMLFTENAPRAAGPLEAETPPSGVIDDAIFLQKLVTIDAGSGKMRTVSPEGLYIYEYDWAPDGGHFVYTAAPGPGDDNWWKAKLYTLDVASGAVKMVHETPLQMAAPRWSPDGSTIAFIEGIMSDEGATGGDIYTVAAAGGEAVDRTPGRKSSPSWLSWLPSSKRILFAETVGGSTAVATLDLASGTAETAWKGDESVSAGGEEFSLSKDGAEAAAIRSSWTMAPEVWAGPIGRWGQVSRANAGMKPAWGEARSVTWRSGDSQVQGWLVLPAGYEGGGKRYPMVVSVHGGPASARKPSWPQSFFDMTLLSKEGYFVFFPNPRGSYGQGEAFTEANVKDFGDGDLKDILAGVDAVTAEYAVDARASGDRRVELWRIHDDVGGDADAAVSRGGGGGGDFQLAELLRAEFHRSVDDSLFRRVGLRRPGGVRQELADQFRQGREDADAGGGGRQRWRVPGAAVVRILARAEEFRGEDAVGGVSGRGAQVPEARAYAGLDAADGGLVRRQYEIAAGRA